MFKEWLDAIPTEVWSGLAGATAALLGTWLANRHARKMQSQQLAFEKAERARDRLMSVRREVYLPAIDAAARMVTTYAKITEAKSGFELIGKAWIEFSSAMAKVQMVAGERTIRAVAELVRKHERVLVSVMDDGLTIQMLHSKANVVNGLRERQLSESQRIIELMRAFNLEGRSDQQEWDRLNRAVDASEAALEELTTDYGELCKKQIAMNVQVAHNAMPPLHDLVDVHSEALIAIRLELDISDGGDALADEARRTAIASKEQLQKILSSLQKRILEEMED
jgi:hypothetical protein